MFSFTPLRGFFSPFPHGTRTLSVSTEYLALEDGPPGFRQGFSCPALLTNNTARSTAFVYRTITFFGAAFQPASTSDRYCNSRPEIRLRNVSSYNPARATPECLHTNGLGCSLFARHYWGNLD
jgi:hypothetical protein